MHAGMNIFARLTSWSMCMLWRILSAFSESALDSMMASSSFEALFFSSRTRSIRVLAKGLMSLRMRAVMMCRPLLSWVAGGMKEKCSGWRGKKYIKYIHILKNGYGMWMVSNSCRAKILSYCKAKQTGFQRSLDHLITFDDWKHILSCKSVTLLTRHMTILWSIQLCVTVYISASLVCLSGYMKIHGLVCVLQWPEWGQEEKIEG